MAKNERAVGAVRRIGPLATGLKSGSLVIQAGWPGVVQKDIIGTTEPQTTIDGRPVKGLLGDGLGDIQLEGVFKFVDENGATSLGDGDRVDRVSPSGVKKATGLGGASTVGHVFGPAYVEEGIRFVDVKLLGRPNT